MTPVIILGAITTVIEGAAALSAAAGGPWRLVPVGPDDRPVLDALFADCSAQTVRLRFFGAPRTLPPEYAAELLAGRPDVHDALVAYPRPHDGRYATTGPHPVGPVGLASLATDPGSYPLTAELGVLVSDAWQRRGAGAAMTAALLDRARARGVERVAACVLPARAALLRAMAGRLGLVPAASPAPGAPPAVTYDRTGDSLTAVYRLRPTADRRGTRGKAPDDEAPDDDT
ncbi:GNAT family N-acetyltransferase [Streptomyces sp. V4-01]|uniref:GNAT family N-acetyltransferase n=1 Tax=Actinacidiphila polyblastidii TaxID=3110430 RepID=A0ABU7PFR4_9ACTN|nr:GNAT family N-acetyltransferase [Streptomyces sp. V4-01]